MHLHDDYTSEPLSKLRDSLVSVFKDFSREIYDNLRCQKYKSSGLTAVVQRKMRNMVAIIFLMTVLSMVNSLSWTEVTTLVASDKNPCGKGVMPESCECDGKAVPPTKE